MKKVVQAYEKEIGKRMNRRAIIFFIKKDLEN